MRITSEAFADGGQMPERYTKDGQDMSPPLAFEGVPRGTKELALLFECLTPSTRAPTLQWLLYRIPAERRGLPEGMRRKADPGEPKEARHGTNDIGDLGYEGPLGIVTQPYRDRFRLLALDQALDLEPGADRKAFERAIRGHVLDQADLHVTYDRPR